MTAGHFKPHMLTWARKRCGFSTDDMAHKLGVDIQHVLAWEAGGAKPDFDSAQKFADRTHIPLGYLLLKQPPELPMPVVDFRTDWTQSPSLEEEVNLKALLYKISSKKNWLEEHLENQGDDTPGSAFQGTFDKNADYREVAACIVDHIGLHMRNEPQGRGGPQEFWRDFSQRVVNANIWLMQTSIVGNDATRRVSPKTCRGIALKSRYRPIIWVNSALAFAPRVFTLAHELAHLWISSEGVTNQEEDNSVKSEIESLCDEVAAEMLVPEAALNSLWNRKNDARDNVERLCQHFGVSRFTIARKSAQAGLISEDEYGKLKRAFGKGTPSQGKPPKLSEEGNKSFYPELLARNGVYFIETLVCALDRSHLLWREGTRLLDVKSTETILGASDYLIGPDVEIADWA